MKKFLAFLLLNFIIQYNCFAQQAPGIEWQKCFGGSAVDVAFQIQGTYDGGYAVSGFTFSNNGDVSGNHGSHDYWVIKLDSVGNLQWQKSLGGSGSEESQSLVQTTDSGFAIIGTATSIDFDVTGNLDSNSTSYWFVKLDKVGNIQWQKTYGGDEVEEATKVKQTPDNGFILIGNSNSNDSAVTGNHGLDDYWILKIDSIGNKQWEKSFGGIYRDRATFVDNTYDNGFIIIGSTESIGGNVTGYHGLADYWLIKLNSLGTLLWQKCLGGTGAELGYSVEETNDKGFILSGATTSNNYDVSGNHGDYDYWVVKCDSLGNIQWQKCYGGSYIDISYSITQVDDGGYVIAGSSASIDGNLTFNHGANDYWILKIDTLGNIQWQKSFGGNGGDEPYSIIQTKDKGYVIAGATDSNNGDVMGNHGIADYWIVKLSPDTLTSTTNIQSSKNNFKIFPNPATDYLSLTLSTGEGISSCLIKIYDVFGNLVLNKLTNSANCQLPLANFPSGIYFVEVKSGKEIYRTKFVKE